MTPPSDSALLTPELVCWRGVELDQRVLPALERLAQSAQAQGFDLAVASGYRSVERQLAIWNAKACGQRAVLDDNNNAVDLSQLDELGRVEAIMRFSALPGSSRHHWGCDLDVYDRAALGAGESVQLLPSESAPGGPFYEFHRWLDARIAAGEAEGFFRPYAVDRGGVAPEPWHLSYAPLAYHCQRSLSCARLGALIETLEIGFKTVILDNLPELYRRFIEVPLDCYPTCAEDATDTTLRL